MGYLAERVSYLRGLVEGINLDKSTPESRIFDEFLEVLDDVATSVEGLEENQDEISKELEQTQQDVDDLFDIFCGDEDEDGDDYEEYDYDDEDEDGDDVEEDEEYCETLSCPNCGAVLPIDVDLLEEDELVLKCPECGEDVTISVMDDDEDEDEDEECTGDCASCPSNREN